MISISLGIQADPSPFSEHPEGMLLFANDVCNQRLEMEPSRTKLSEISVPPDAKLLTFFGQ